MTRTQGLGYEPQKVRLGTTRVWLSKYEAQAFAYEQQGFGYEPQGFGYEPHGFGYEPQGFGYEPQGFGYDPQGSSWSLGLLVYWSLGLLVYIGHRAPGPGHRAPGTAAEFADIRASNPLSRQARTSQCVHIDWLWLKQFCFKSF